MDGTIVVRRVPVCELNPAPYNPRKDLKAGDPEYEKLLRSIEHYGYIDPIVWNELTGNVVSGHQRLKILIAKGFKEVDVSVVSLNDVEEKALNLAMNKITGEWDEELLSDILSEIALDTENMLINLTGFSENEISELVKSLGETESEINTVGNEGLKNSNFTYSEQYGVIVLCANEEEQKSIYESLSTQGLTCKVVAT